MEKMDAYNYDRQLIGKTFDRYQPTPENCCRLVVHACIFNDKGEMLIQQRSHTRSSNPNKWDISVGGGVLAGETSSIACSRELNEELNINMDLNGVRPSLTINFYAGFDDYYLLKHNYDITKFMVTDEVQAVKWATKKQVLKMIKKKTFINYYPSLIEFMFDRVGALGAFVTQIPQ